MGAQQATGLARAQEMQDTMGEFIRRDSEGDSFKTHCPAVRKSDL